MGSAYGARRSRRGLALISLPMPIGVAKTQQTHIESSLLTDVTSVTNIGLLIGALIAANFAATRGRDSGKRATMAGRDHDRLRAGLLGATGIRLQCRRVLSGISTGSLHGWVWMAAAFAGSL